MNATCFMLSPFFTPWICPDLRIFMASYPCTVRHAVSHEKKPIPSLINRQDEAVILLDQVVEIVTLPQFTSIWQDPFRFQLLERFRIGCVLINRDDARSAAMRRSQRFREEAFSSFRIAPRAQEEFQDVSLANPQLDSGTSTPFSLLHTFHRRATSHSSR